MIVLPQGASRRVPLPWLRDVENPAQTVFNMGLELMQKNIPAASEVRCLGLSVSWCVSMVVSIV